MEAKSSFLSQLLLDMSHSTVFPVVLCLRRHQSCRLWPSTLWSVACMNRGVYLTRRSMVAMSLLLAFPRYDYRLFVVALSVLAYSAGFVSSCTGTWSSCADNYQPLLLHSAVFLYCCQSAMSLQCFVVAIARDLSVASFSKVIFSIVFCLLW